MSNIIEDDWKLIGYVITGCIGCIIITFLLIDLIRNFIKNPEAHYTQKYLSILSISTALLLCFMVAFIKTNLIVRDFNHTANGLPCKLSSAISGTFYIISKYSMYVLFTYRIQLVFQTSIYAISQKLLTTMRYIIITLAIAFCILTNIPEKEEVKTPTYGISHCTMKKGEFDKFGSIIIIIFVMTDLFLLIWLLWLFNSKLYKMSKLLTNGLQQNEQTNDFLKTINKQLIKSTILVSTSIISTLFFVFVGVFLWKPIGWFMPLDMTVNALSIYLMYTFSRKMYECCCYVCIKCCSLCIKGADKEIFWNILLPKLTIGDNSSITNYSTTTTTNTNTTSIKIDISNKNISHHVIGHSTSTLQENIQLCELPIANNQTGITTTPANNINL